MRYILTFALCAFAATAQPQDLAPTSETPANAAPSAAPIADASPTDASLILGATDGYADNNGTKIHYVSLGQGRPIIFIHGFPDFWYSWRHQMKDLSKDYRCVAVDQRGFNLSDKPVGVENYKVEVLVTDIAAVLNDIGAKSATIVGHDWGGFVAWWFAAYQPDLVDHLIICNLPHPKCLSRELANNPEQQRMSEYAQAFRREDAATSLDKDLFATMAVGNDQAAFPAYRAAMAKSDLVAMLNYYKANYPAAPYTEDPREVPKIQAPVLVFHGLQDPALHVNGLNNTWEWINNTTTLVTVPKAAHWVQSDAPDYVTNTISDWLRRN